MAKHSWHGLNRVGIHPTNRILIAFTHYMACSGHGGIAVSGLGGLSLGYGAVGILGCIGSVSLSGGSMVSLVLFSDCLMLSSHA